MTTPSITATMNWQPNFDWITDHLAVGGSFPSQRTERLAREHAIRGVVDLREECCDDAEELTRHGLRFLHLPTEDCCAVQTEMLHAGVAFTNEHLARGERVLIHCEHGIGRSATLGLCVLVDRGHTPRAALALMKRRRALVSPSLAQFAAWNRWLDEHEALAARAHQRLSEEEFKRLAWGC